jgi:hypothetical protein
MLAKIYEVVDCGFDAEPEVAKAAKAANPKISEEELR